MDMSSATSNGMPVQQGAMAGAAAFIVGLVLTFVIGMAGLSQGLALLVGFLPLQGTILGFTSFHIWPLVMGGAMGGFIIWTIVPIIVLVASGYFVANNSDSGTSGFMAGASVTVGYLILTILSFLVLFAMSSGGGGGTQTASTGVQIGQLLVGIIFTGVIFPVVFGGIGGALADM